MNIKLATKIILSFLSIITLLFSKLINKQYATERTNRLTPMAKDATIEGTLVLNTNSLGLDPDYLEATCFAWLAQQKLENKKFNLSRITGSKKPLSLGKVWSS